MPSALELCLSLVATDEDREDRLGDIAEAYAYDVISVGEAEARRRHWHNIASTVISIAWRRSNDFFQGAALPAMVATLIALTGYGTFVRSTAETWWMKSGFERNPGYFVSENQIDYPICEPIGAKAARGPDQHVSEVRTHALLIPQSAKIVRITCSGHAAAGGISDNNYTQGRVLILAAQDARDMAAARYWVVWKE